MTLIKFYPATQGKRDNNPSFFGHMQKLTTHLQQIGRDRCSEMMATTMRSFMRFRNGQDITASHITSETVEHYEAYLRQRGVKRNTCSFYMRNLRRAYLLAVDEGQTANNRPFRKVYTGVDKTVKRSISLDAIRRLRNLELAAYHHLDFARDMLLLCFYLRGISFVDLAFLRKSDVHEGYIIYHRRKTGQTLMVEMPKEAAAIIAKHQSKTDYLLPIIKHEDDKERRQYLNAIGRVNRNLKRVAQMSGLSNNLTTYVMRHSWATIARDKGIGLPVISRALGHENEKTTQIYLNSMSNCVIDRANRLILDEL